jgi:hypothetical protein
MIPAMSDSVNAIAQKASEGFLDKALLALLPGALTALVAWLTSLAVSSRRASELDMLLRRIQLVEHLQKLQGENDAPLRMELETEVHDIVAALADLRKIDVGHHPSTDVSAKRSGWREWIIAYKQASVKASVYKLVFYVSSGIGLIATLGVLALAADQTEVVDDRLQTAFFGLVGGAVYLAIGLAFRAAAVRDYRKRVQTRGNR